MKTASAVSKPFWANPVVPFPNAISRRQFFHKLLDTALVAVSGIGIAVMVIFLLLV